MNGNENKDAHGDKAADICRIFALGSTLFNRLFLLLSMHYIHL